ncbi:MAG: hypothetical protein ABSF95_21975 [Verrucomicrobiota bacterium]|jgi:hypothetical protein
MKTLVRAALFLLTAVSFGCRASGQSLAEPDVPTGLLERKGDKIVAAPAEDLALAKTYHAFKDKGPLVAGQRITIMTRNTQYRIGEPVRVLHILEAVEPGKSVHLMGPKKVYGEYVDGKLVTPKGPGKDPYRGMVADRPIADFNYEISTYTFTGPGLHTIQWKGGGASVQGPLGLESNIIKLEVFIEPKNRSPEPSVTASEPAKVAPDPIQRLVARLSSSHGLWQNGLFPKLDLPATASTEQVVSRVFQMSGFDKGHVTTHRILETRQVRIPGSLPDIYTAVLVDTDLGKKIVLLKHEGPAAGWWSRVYDAETSGSVQRPGGLLTNLQRVLSNTWSGARAGIRVVVRPGCANDETAT